MPGACFSVELGLRGAELPPAFEAIDLRGLRAGISLGEVCDTADGRLDGTLRVEGPLEPVLQEIATELATSPQGDDLRPLLDDLVLTVELTWTRHSGMPGGAGGDDVVPPVAISLADVMDEHDIHVVSQRPQEDASSNSDDASEATATPPASDGTGIID